MATESEGIRVVSVIVPMRNEAHHIEHLVADIAAQDVGLETELLVADGASTDDSAWRLRAAAGQYGISLTIVENPERWVSHGLNRCIRLARGDLIVRLDCHSRYPTDYLRRCVAAAEQTGAENVGGIFVPKGRTPTERAVACATDSPFGGIHWTRHRSGERNEVDTVPYGAFRPSAFERAGLFDETLLRNQDDEFNLRLRLAGGRIILDPSIRIYYVPRSTFKRLFRQYYEYGRWKPAVMRKHRRATSARSLAPALFVSTIVALVAISNHAPLARRLLKLQLGAYGAGVGIFGVAALRRRREHWRLLPRVAAVFPTLHIAYGLGMVIGLLRSNNSA